MNKQKKSAVLWGLGICLLAGCIVSGTFVRSLPIDEFISKSDGTFSAHGVDLTEDQVWKDHQDDIKNITDVRFRAKIENRSEVHATGQIYFSYNGNYTTPAAVRAAAEGSAPDAFIVFGELGIPAGEEIQLTFTESANYRQNLDRALKLIKTGRFYLYALTPAGPFDLHVYDAYVMITFDAGKA